MAIASIKFTQGLNVGVLGQVLVGVVNASVTVENAVDPAIKSWRIELLGVGPGSTLTAGTLAQNATDSTPITTFVPDVPGSYRIRVTVWDSVNFTGVGSVDIRNFMVKGRRFFLPPYQRDPDPLPTLASGHATAQPNETNIGGTELGWHGTGADGLLADFITAVDGFFPRNIDRPFSMVGVTGSTGEPLLAFPLQALVTADTVLLFGYISFVLQRTPHTTIGIDEIYRIPAGDSSKFYLIDAVWDGSRAYLVGSDTGGANGYLQEITPIPLALGTRNTLDVTDGLSSIDYDGAGFLWIVAGGSGKVYKVATSDLTTIVATITTGNVLGVARIDRNGFTYFDSLARGFFINQTTWHLVRFTLQSTPASDASCSVSSGTRALAVGGGSFPGVIYYGGNRELGRIDADLATAGLTVTAIPYWIAINSLDFMGVEAGDFLFGLCETAQGDIVVAQINPTNLAVVGLTRLSETHENIGFGTAAGQTRCNADGGFVWVPDTHIGDLGIKYAGSYYSVVPFTSSQLAVGTVGSITSAGNVLTDGTKDFVTAGVRVGDLLVNDSEAATYYYHRITQVDATQLTIADTFSATSGAVLYRVYRPMTTTLVPLPGAKKLELLSNEWKSFSVNFVGASGGSTLNNGKFVAFYRQVGDTLDLQYGLTMGSATVVDPTGILLELPPGFVIDIDRMVQTSGLFGVANAQVSDPLGNFDKTMAVSCVYQECGLIYDLSTLAVGNVVAIRFSVPLKLF